MRTIKFRGLTSRGKWIYGSYHSCVGNTKFYEKEYVNGRMQVVEKDKYLDNHFILQKAMPDGPGWNTQDTFNSYDVKKETVSQFTGSVDKHNNEIYEGDILKGFFNGINIRNLDTVIFENGKFNLKNTPMELIDVTYSLSKYQCEVIGNIHEHGHLIK